MEDFTEVLDLKPLFEQLTLCPFAVADLTFASANLYYELGVRQARPPGTTVMLYSDNETTPLSPGALNVIPYSLTADGTPADVTAPRREAWEPETTVRNLRLIREARAKWGEDLSWAREIEQALEQKARDVQASPSG